MLAPQSHPSFTGVLHYSVASPTASAGPPDPSRSLDFGRDLKQKLCRGSNNACSLRTRTARRSACARRSCTGTPTRRSPKRARGQSRSARGSPTSCSSTARPRTGARTTACSATRSPAGCSTTSGTRRPSAPPWPPPGSIGRCGRSTTAGTRASRTLRRQASAPPRS